MAVPRHTCGPERILWRGTNEVGCETYALQLRRERCPVPLWLGADLRAQAAPHPDALQLLHMPPLWSTVGLLQAVLSADQGSQGRPRAVFLEPPHPELSPLQEMRLHHPLHSSKEELLGERRRQCEQFRPVFDSTRAGPAPGRRLELEVPGLTGTHPLRLARARRGAAAATRSPGGWLSFSVMVPGMCCLAQRTNASSTLPRSLPLGVSV